MSQASREAAGGAHDSPLIERYPEFEAALERKHGAGGRDVRVCIVGTGAVASALARALASTASPAHGMPGAASPIPPAEAPPIPRAPVSFDLRIFGRDAARAAALAERTGALHARLLEDLRPCDLIVIAVSDAAIGEVSEAVARHLVPGTVMLHTAGATLGRTAMAGAAASTMQRGSLHPLVAVAPDASPWVFWHMPFAVECDGEAGLALARAVVAALGGTLLALPGADESSKQRYHALATMVASGVVALVDRAARTMAESGGDRDAFRRAYGSLAASAAANVQRAPGAHILTGAIARGDHALVELHRAALAGHDAAALYEAVLGAARAMLADGETP